MNMYGVRRYLTRKGYSVMPGVVDRADGERRKTLYVRHGVRRGTDEAALADAFVRFYAKKHGYDFEDTDWFGQPCILIYDNQAEVEA